MKLRRRLRPCIECSGPAPLSSGETWLAGEPAEALQICRFRVYPVSCHSKRKCPQAGKGKRSSRRRAAGCPKRHQVAALESGPIDASPLGKATGRSGLRVSNSFVKATKLTTRFTTKFAPGFVRQAALRLSFLWAASRALSSRKPVEILAIKDRGRDDALDCAAPPSEPDVRISRIRLSSQHFAPFRRLISFSRALLRLKSPRFSK